VIFKLKQLTMIFNTQILCLDVQLRTFFCISKSHYSAFIANKLHAVQVFSLQQSWWDA